MSIPTITAKRGTEGPRRRWNGMGERNGNSERNARSWLHRSSEDVTTRRMYEVDCIFYKIVVSEEHLKCYGINCANLQKVDAKAMRLERAERQRNVDNIRRPDPTSFKPGKRKRSMPPSSPPSPPCMEEIIQVPERTRPFPRIRGACISLAAWFRSYWFGMQIGPRNLPLWNIVLRS